MVTVLAALALVQQKDIVNDDRDVIQAAMLSFFHHKVWYDVMWKPKDYVILRTQLRTKERDDFKQEARQLYTQLQNEKIDFQEFMQRSDPTDPRSNNYKAEFDELLDSIKGLKPVIKDLDAKPTYTPPPLVPLKSMAWDDRILVSDVAHPWRTTHDNKYVGRPEDLYASANRPSYSPDGHYAIVEFGVPWSIHSASVTFVLERVPGKWIILANHHVFYV